MSLPIQPDVYTDFQGLANLKARARVPESPDSPATLREVARQFEALFIGLMLKEARKTDFGDGLFDSQQMDFYQGMFDQQIALEMARGRGLGLADMLVRQLGGATAEPTAPATRPLPARAGSAGGGGAVDAAAGAGQPDWRPETPAEFVRELWLHAERAARELGTDAEAIVAQAALETGWGRHVLRRPDGRSSFNLFGIKAGSGWDGETVAATTLEFDGAAMRRTRASFRAYPGIAASVQDYVDFLKGNARYRDVVSGQTDVAGFLHGLQRAGYATDPDYASKIMQIMDSPGFVQSVTAVKKSASAADSRGSAG